MAFGLDRLGSWAAVGWQGRAQQSPPSSGRESSARRDARRRRSTEAAKMSWSPRASPPQLSPLASGSEDDHHHHHIGQLRRRSADCTVVLNPLPSDMLESLSSDGHVRMGLPTPPDSVRGDDVEQETVSELLRDMVDCLDTPRTHHRKKKRKSSRSRHRRDTIEEEDECPSVSPIFVWVRQAEDGVIGEVWCEDYDKRNRLRLTKTSGGWRAIPRTPTLSELERGAKPQRRDSADSACFSDAEDEPETIKVTDKVVQLPDTPDTEPEVDSVRVNIPEEEPVNKMETEKIAAPVDSLSISVPDCELIRTVPDSLQIRVLVKQEVLEQVADLSAKKREPGPLPCRSPLLRLPPLPRRPLPSPVLQQPPCDFRTPSPAHQAQPLALPPRSPLPAHQPKRPLEVPHVEVPPAKKHKTEPTLRGLLSRDVSSTHHHQQESRLLELLTGCGSPKPPDALAQLRLVVTQLRVPDPLLIPQSRLSALLASPAAEIPRLLAAPPSPDVIPVALDRLQALLQRPDSELLAWAAQDWAQPWYPAPFCAPPLDAWHTPSPRRQQQPPPRVAAPFKNAPPPGHAPSKPRIVCKALSELMPKKKAPKPPASPQLVSPPPDLIATALPPAAKTLPQLWHPLFGRLVEFLPFITPKNLFAAILSLRY